MARPWSARCYGVARQREGSRQNSIGGPALTSFITLNARARALMARPWSARCYGVARQREGSRQNSIGGSGVLSLRHFGLVLFIPWRVGAEESAAAKLVWFRPARCCSTGSGAPSRFRFIDFGAPR